MPGPLPNPQSRRRNSPTISTNTLPLNGREGRAPSVPKAYRLGKSGAAWWRWAWKLPQAARWDDGALYFVVRRAQLEDDLTALDYNDEGLSDLIADAIGADVDELRDVLSGVETVIRKLKSLAGGRVGVMKEMRELDNRLGLNPKAMADLRWVLGEEAKEAKAAPAPGATVRRLKAVDSSAAG